MKTVSFRATSSFVFALAMAFPAVALGQGAGNAIPVVTVKASIPAASESGDAGAFRLFRDGPTNAALYVYWVISGTASNGVDFKSLSSFVSIPAGIREVIVPVVPIEDNLPEAPETVFAQLAYSPLAMPINYQIGVPSNAAVTITDNDQPLSVNIVAPTNGQSFPPPASINISVRTVDLDTSQQVASVEFFEGEDSLGVVTDYIASSPPLDIRHYGLTWSNVAAGIYNLWARAAQTDGTVTTSAPVQIMVGPDYTPPPTVTIQATDPNAAETCALGVIQAGEFTISRSHGTNDPLAVYVSIHGTAFNGVDYFAISNTIVIPAGRLSTTVPVIPYNDALTEGTETVVMRVESPVCIAIYPPPYACYAVGVPAEAVVSIADCPSTNVPPEVRITKPYDGQLFLVPTNVVIVADTADKDGYVWKVEFYADGTRIGTAIKYFFAPPPPGQRIGYEFTWTNPPPGGHVLTALATDDGGATALSALTKIWVLTNLPPPIPVVTISAPDPVASEGSNCVRWIGWPVATAANFCGTNTAAFAVHRSGPTNAALRVFYEIGGTASNGVDYAWLPGNVIIPEGYPGAEFKVVPLDDNVPERTETVVVALRTVPPTPSVPLSYAVGMPRRAAAIIVDNDRPRPATGELSDGCFHLTRPGANGDWFRIECSGDLAHWTPICTNSVTDGAMHFVDPDADEASEQFYRIVAEPNPPVNADP